MRVHVGWVYDMKHAGGVARRNECLLALQTPRPLSLPRRASHCRRSLQRVAACALFCGWWASVRALGSQLKVAEMS